MQMGIGAAIPGREAGMDKASKIIRHSPSSDFFVFLKGRVSLACAVAAVQRMSLKNLLLTEFGAARRHSIRSM